MKTLEESRKQKLWWEDNVHTKKQEFELAKRTVKKMELELKAAKKVKNKVERELKFGKKQVEKLDRSIKTTPSRVRKWGKEHPGELIKTLEGGRT